MVEEYQKAVDFACNEDNKKHDIFIFATQNESNINSILGIIDGIILRDDDSFLNGFIKQFKHLLSEDDIFLTLEHACLCGKDNLVKILTKLIKNNDKLIDTYSYIKQKSPSCAAILEKYVGKNILNKQITNETSSNNITNNTTNIIIENLTLNLYNLALDNKNDNIYFKRITRGNNLLSS